MVAHFYVKFGDTSCIGFWDIVRKSRQTNRQTKPMKTPPPPTAVGVVMKYSVPFWLTVA